VTMPAGADEPIDPIVKPAEPLPSSSPLSVSYWQSLFREHSSATFAFSFLVAVGVSKTLLTKLIFNHSPTPLAFSVLSCLATNICLVPILIYKKDTPVLTKKMLPGFAGICVAIALDLACQNVALAILSVALQQCIKATAPTATVVVESIIRRKKYHWAIYLSVVTICLGPILVAMQSSWEAKSDAGSQPFGAFMMIVAVIGGAFKAVLCHKAIKEFREQMGILAFTFWVEVFVGFMILPFAIYTGEVSTMWYESGNDFLGWVLVWFTAAFGGVRIVSQFYFLAKTSATSLAMSGIAMQALTIIIGMIAFGTDPTVLLCLGVVFTIVTSAVYMWLKTSSVLVKKLEKKPKNPAKISELVESRIGLRDADSAAEATAVDAAEAPSAEAARAV